MGISVNGIPVATGKPGKAGKSAYEAAIEGGFTGTEAQFQEQLANGIYKSGDIINAKGGRITSVSDGVDSTDAATIAQLTARIEALEAKLTPSITAASTAATEAKTTADNAKTVANGCLPLSGGAMTDDFSLPATKYMRCTSSSGVPTLIHTNLGYGIGFNENQMPSGFSARLQGVATPQYETDAANKQYVDSMLSSSSNPIEYYYIESVYANANSVTFSNYHDKIIVRVVGGYGPSLESFLFPVDKPTAILSGNVSSPINCMLIGLNGTSALNGSNQWSGNGIFINKFTLLATITFNNSKNVTVKANMGSFAIGFDVFGI